MWRADGALYELNEFQGVDRTPLRTGVQDPGSTRFHLTVDNLDAAVRDPNGVCVVLSEEHWQRVGQVPRSTVECRGTCTTGC